MAMLAILFALALQDDAPNGDYGAFHTWPEILEKVEALRKARPDLVHRTTLGKTLEGREIVVLKISDHAARDEDEPEVCLMAGIHPREQPPQVLLLRLLEEILAGYGKDERLTRLVDEREIWVIPVFNVDGKVYDMKHGNGRDEGARWRKNRRPNPDGTVGIDLNRQFPVRWGGTSDVASKPNVTVNSKSDYFIGYGPVTEPETRALMKFVEERPLRVFVDIHSPFKAIFFPRHLAGAEFERYTGLARRMRELQKDPYTLSSARADADPPEERGGDAGVSYDWIYYTQGTYAFIFEIRADPKWYPPEAQIRGEYANFRDPMLHVVDEAARLPLRKEGRASLKEGRLEGRLLPGAKASWSPVVEGPWSYGVLVSEDAAVRVTSEFRAAPLRSGFALRVAPGAKAGARIPMALYLWDADRGRSIARFTLTVD